jgi:Tfp pilus assembly protein PilX
LLKIMRNRPAIRSTNNESGMILVVALMLLAALTMAGATAYIVASTDVKVSGNFRTSQTALQVAMAGTEQARQTLRALNAASANPTNFSEELASRVGANGVLNGYTSSTDDVPIATSSSLVSGYTYTAYLTNDAAEGASSTTDNNGRVMITSVAAGPFNAKAIVTTAVQLYSFPADAPAVVYSKDNVTLNGSAITIDGNDGSSCDGGNLAPVYTQNPSTTTTNGQPTLSGDPSEPQTGPLDIDLEGYIDALKGGASHILTEDSQNSTFGSSSNFVTVYADAVATQADGELKLNNVTGYGILLVKGDLALAGNIDWNGIIIVTGTLTSVGGGSNAKNIQGQIFAGSSALGDTAISGSINIGFHSCNVKKALSSQPLRVVSWKQNY